MLKRLYVHNFRCLENFDLALGEFSSVLLLGKNGSGKSTIAYALEVFQKIARGTNRVNDLVTPHDMTSGRTKAPVRFEMDAILNGQYFSYSLALELPQGFRELRVAEEKLMVSGAPIFTRETAQVRLLRSGIENEAAFRIDWHLVALPIGQERNSDDPLSIFKRWLASILVLRPVPSLAQGDSVQADSAYALPDRQVVKIGAWFSSMISTAPDTYAQISEYLKHIMPDFVKVTNPIFGKDARSLLFHFESGNRNLELSLEELSDGEKCFVVFALTLAASVAFKPLLCFWDEPENYLAPDEVGHSIVALRKAFQSGGQLIVSSHNPEVIRRFSETNILYLARKGHLEPTTYASISDLRANGRFEGTFVDALIRGDVES